MLRECFVYLITLVRVTSNNILILRVLIFGQLQYEPMMGNVL